MFDSGLLEGLVVGVCLGTLMGLRLFRSPSAFALLLGSLLLLPFLLSGGLAEIRSPQEIGGAILATAAYYFLSGFGFVMPISAALACLVVTFSCRGQTSKCGVR